MDIAALQQLPEIRTEQTGEGLMRCNGDTCGTWSCLSDSCGITIVI